MAKVKGSLSLAENFALISETAMSQNQDEMFKSGADDESSVISWLDCETRVADDESENSLLSSCEGSVMKQKAKLAEQKRLLQGRRCRRHSAPQHIIGKVKKFDTFERPHRKSYSVVSSLKRRKS